MRSWRGIVAAQTVRATGFAGPAKLTNEATVTLPAPTEMTRRDVRPTQAETARTTVSGDARSICHPRTLDRARRGLSRQVIAVHPMIRNQRRTRGASSNRARAHCSADGAEPPGRSMLKAASYAPSSAHRPMARIAGTTSLRRAA